MPTFEITSPDGKTYEVEGPEGATKDQALAQVMAQHGGSSTTEKSGGIVPNVAAGFGDFVTGSLDMLDQTLNPYRQVADIINLHKTPLPGETKQPDPKELMGVADQKYWNELLGKIGLNPDSVEAKTLPERLARYGGMGAGAILTPGPGEAGLVAAGSRALTGAASTIAGGFAAEQAPDWLKPVVGLFASLAAGIPFSMGLTAASKIPSQVKNATTLARAGGSNEVAEQTAGKVLAQNATDVDTVKAMLEKGVTPKVAGSEPTTFQATGDMGLGALERSTAVKNPELFRQREAEQNTARRTALDGVSPGASPTAVADYFRGQLHDLDTQTATNIEDRLNTARQATAQVGGDIHPEQLGQTMRDAVASAEAKARVDERGLWKAVDPEGKLTGNVKMTSQKADDIAGAMRKTEKPMEGEEAAVFHQASELPAVAPVADLIALRSRVSTAMRDELTLNGRTPSYARLVQLRGAIQDNLAKTISDTAVAEAPKVASGALAAEDSVTARIAAWRQNLEAERDKFLQQRQAGTGGASGPVGPPGAGATEAPGAGGTALPPGGRPPGAPGNPGLSENAPTFDPAAAERLAAATAATKERAGTFGAGPVGDVLRQAGASNVFRIADAGVPAKFFKPGPAGFQDAKKFIDANRPSEGFVGPNRGVAIMTDAAAQSLRKAAMTDEGILDPRKVMIWQNRHADALRALPPEIHDAFMNARTASQAVAEATTARAEALANFRAGKVGQLLGTSTPEEVSNIVGQTFASPQSATLLKGLANAVRGHVDASAGLKQAVADHIGKKFIGNTEVATSGQAGIKADAFQTFVKQNEPALKAAGFTPAEMDVMKAIADDIRQAKRSQNAVRLPGGSNTAQDVAAGQKQGSILSKVWEQAVAGGAAAAAFHIGGPFAAAPAWIGTRAMQAMREAGIENVEKLVTKAMLDPALAKRLLEKVPAGASLKAPLTDAMLARAIRRSAVPAVIVAENKRSGATP